MPPKPSASMLTTAALALALALPMTSPAFAQVEVEAPRGGWNSSGLVDQEDAVAVQYPPSLIDRGAQKGRTLIRGRLAPFDQERPHTLVVNGNPMPLYAGEGGRFARPYAFGAGSNSIEVRSPDGGDRKRLQFYEASTTKTPAKVRIILGWDDNQAEVDLHVVTPDGQHAFWGQPVLPAGGGLDVDSVDGAGPEMFSAAEPVRGAYHVYVNYWGNFGGEGYHFDEKTRKRDVITASVTLIFHENTSREKRETFVAPLRKIGDLTLVKSFLF